MRKSLLGIGVAFLTITIMLTITYIMYGCIAGENAKFNTLYAAPPIPPQSEILFNGDFKNDLSGWRIFCAEKDGRHRGRLIPGTIEWSPEYGGSAKVVVSGAPSSMDLQQEFNCFVPEGSIITIEIIKDPDNASGWNAFIGGLGVKELLSSKETIGRDLVTYRTKREYFKGTPLTLHFAVWPGSATFYIKNVAVSVP